MIGKLSLEQELSDCVVGESKTITLTVTPTVNADGKFEADIESVEDYEEETPEKPEKEMPMKDKDMGKMHKGMAPGVTIILAGKAK